MLACARGAPEAGLPAGQGEPVAGLVRHEFSRPAMGTLFRVVLYARDEAAAARAAGEAFERVAELDARLSDYDASSELSRLSARATDGPTGPVPVSADVFTVLARAQTVATRTDGAFDVTVGPYVQLWRLSRSTGRPPEARELEARAASVGFGRLRLDPERRTVTLDAGGMALDLGGIAKGYALDEALAVLRRHGIERALVDGGGDVAAGAPPPGRRGWRVAIEPFTGEMHDAPLVLELSHAALATSGDTYAGLEVDGVRHAHIVDPRTGRALTEGVGATVLARDGMTADALASAACVLGPAAALALVESWEDAEVRAVSGAGETTRVLRSSGFPERADLRARGR